MCLIWGFSAIKNATSLFWSSITVLITFSTSYYLRYYFIPIIDEGQQKREAKTHTHTHTHTLTHTQTAHQSSHDL